MSPAFNGDSIAALRALAALVAADAECADAGDEDEGGEALRPLRALARRLRRPGAKAAVQALQDFAEAGRRCLKQLQSDDIDVLRRCCVGAAHAGPKLQRRPTSASSTSTVATDTEVRRVKLIFDNFDTDNDGLISKLQFKDVLVALGLKDTLSDEDINTLVDAADKNDDGHINLQEFAEWLYANTGVGAPESPVASPSPEPEGGDRGDRANIESSLRRQLCAVRAELEALQAKAADDAAAASNARAAEQRAAEDRTAAQRATRALQEAENAHERDTEASFDFWRSVCDTSAAPTLGTKVDLASAVVLGNGRYGFVIKCRTHTDRPVVVKLMGIRWAHVASKEWAQAQAVGKHENVVKYESAMLHHDGDKLLNSLLRKGQEEGKLQGKSRSKFPDRYICLLEEYMNRGTVQDWMTSGTLLPGGILEVMKRVATGLAFMHAKGITHNDVKPENVLLHQEDSSNARSEVIVKLADLGLANYSKDRTPDFTQYGLTVHSMTTGMRFGERKFRVEMAAEFVAEVSGVTKDVEGVSPKLAEALSAVPDVLRRVWAEDILFAEVSVLELLQGWTFFDGEVAKLAGDGGGMAEPPGTPAVTPAGTLAVSPSGLEVPRRMSAHSIDADVVLSMGQMSARFRRDGGEVDPERDH